MTLFWLLKGCLKIYVAKMSCREMFTHNITDKKPPLFDPQNHSNLLYFMKNLSPLYPLMSTVTPDVLVYCRASTSLALVRC